MSNKRTATNWIPYHKELTRKEEVLLIAADTEMSVWEVTGRLMDFWAFVDSNFVPNKEGQMSLKKRTLVPFLSSICPSHFLQSLIEVGWLIDDGDFYAIPHADRFLGETAKKRLKEAEKKRNQRLCPKIVPDKEGQKGDKCPEIKGTKTGPEKEKEKEYKEEEEEESARRARFAEAPSLDQAVKAGELVQPDPIPPAAVEGWWEGHQLNHWQVLEGGRPWANCLRAWWKKIPPKDRLKWSLSADKPQGNTNTPPKASGRKLTASERVLQEMGIPEHQWDTYGKNS